MSRTDLGASTASLDVSDAEDYGHVVADEFKMSLKEKKEEKEFVDQSTRKNLLNVKNKLDRAMSDLSNTIYPVIMMNDKTNESDINDASSRLSSKRRSSFGSVDSQRAAEHFVDRSQKQGRQTAADKVFSNLNVEVVMRQQAKHENPLIARNLRELVMVDDRLDSDEFNSKLFKSDNIDWAARAESERKRRDEIQRLAGIAKRKAEQATPDEDDERYDISTVPNRSPRMRHMRSYRCATQRELNEFRIDRANDGTKKNKNN